MHSFYLLAPLVVLTGQIMALNVPLGKMNFTAGQLLDFGSSQSFVSQANCTTMCDPATSILKQCGSNDTCTCQNETGMAMLNCEQCLFTHIVDQNIPSPNPLIGSQSALDAFVAACTGPPLIGIVMPLKMTIPPSMHGPVSLPLGTGGSVVAVAAGTLLGFAGVYLFSTLE